MNTSLLRILFLVIGSLFFTANAQVPKMGNDTLLDIACWNIEWFGDATSGHGPSNEATQFNNVKEVLNNTDIDVWSLEEVSDVTAWQNLTAALPQYEYSITSYSQTQKTALIWKKNKFDYISSGSVLTGSEYYTAFASGRVPFEVVLKTKGTADIDTIYFYVLHLKANASGDNQPNYDRRKAAGEYLKTFLDQNRAGKKVVVLGDWNDELNGSTVGTNESPFMNFQNDVANYFYICKQLSNQGKKSYASSFGKMIDHILVSNPLKEFYVNASSKVLDNLPTYVSGFSSNTSDHYPVMGFFNMKRYAVDTPVTGIADLTETTLSVPCFPNPTSGFITIYTMDDIKDIIVYDQLGKVVQIKRMNDTNGQIGVELPENISNGVYFIHLISNDKVAKSKIILQR